MVLSLKAVHSTVMCDYPNESYWAVPSYTNFNIIASALFNFFHYKWQLPLLSIQKELLYKVVPSGRSANPKLVHLWTFKYSQTCQAEWFTVIYMFHFNFFFSKGNEGASFLNFWARSSWEREANGTSIDCHQLVI